MIGRDRRAGQHRVDSGANVGRSHRLVVAWPRSVELTAVHQSALAVEDEGPGVPLELRDTLFKPFVSSKGEGGMGMGLYMAKLIIDSHAGEIVVLDRPQGGARFEVRLAAIEEKQT